MVNGNPYRLTAEANLTSISVSVECINAHRWNLQWQNQV